MCARLTLRCAIVDDERETWTAFILNTEVKEEEDEVEWHGSSLSLLPELEDPPPNQAIPPSIRLHCTLCPNSSHSSQLTAHTWMMIYHQSRSTPSRPPALTLLRSRRHLVKTVSLTSTTRNSSYAGSRTRCPLPLQPRHYAMSSTDGDAAPSVFSRSATWSAQLFPLARCEIWN